MMRHAGGYGILTMKKSVGVVRASAENLGKEGAGGTDFVHKSQEPVGPGG